MSAPLIRVYYVCGITPDGVVTDLAKFFRAEHARAHLERFPRVSRQAPYREVGVVIREERPEDQHPSHQGQPGVHGAAWE